MCHSRLAVKDARAVAVPGIGEEVNHIPVRAWLDHQAFEVFAEGVGPVFPAVAPVGGAENFPDVGRPCPVFQAGILQSLLLNAQTSGYARRAARMMPSCPAMLV